MICPNCNGTGKVLVEADPESFLYVIFPDLHQFYITKVCDKCNGAGYLISDVPEDFVAELN